MNKNVKWTRRIIKQYAIKGKKEREKEEKNDTSSARNNALWNGSQLNQDLFLNSYIFLNTRKGQLKRIY